MNAADKLMKKWSRQPNGPVPISTTVKTEDLRVELLNAHIAGMKEAAGMLAARMVGLNPNSIEVVALDHAKDAVLLAANAKAGE